jgi:N-terminal domain of toast_rack, DUF2154/Domain of unknown function (DUF5668)
MAQDVSPQGSPAPPAPQGRPARRPSLVFPVVLIAVGALFLYANWRPAFDPWRILGTYWPLILIFVGLGKMWDSARERNNPQGARGGVPRGSTVGVLAFIAVLFLLFWHGHVFSRDRHVYLQHQTRTVELQSAKSVHASLEAGSGEFIISGGSTHLVDAEFDYASSLETPRVEYNVSNGVGELTISQDKEGTHTHFGADRNKWNLRFSREVPLELRIEMGAGRGDLRLRDLQVNRLDVSMGAGQVDLDLTGDRKSDLTANLEGGVGQATIHLPKNVGVVAEASGGIGSISVHGLKHDGDEYTNDAYGKTPATIHLKVEGGVGEISLLQEP